MSTFKIGDIAYVYDACWGVCEVTIEDIKETENTAWVAFGYPVDKNGDPNRDYKHGGSSSRFLIPDETYKLYDIWKTAKEVYDLVAKNTEEYERQLRNSINSIEDLLKFPLENCLFGEDCDYLAVKIYKEKVKELLGKNL